MIANLSERRNVFIRLILLCVSVFAIFAFTSRFVPVTPAKEEVIQGDPGPDFSKSTISGTTIRPVLATAKTPSTPVETANKKIVLFYTNWYGAQYWLKEGNLDDNFYTLNVNGFNCPQECLYTHNKSYAELADLVFASLVDLNRKEKIDIPINRRVEQVWAGFICESPINVDVNRLLRINNNRFNWTATYRRDSDVYWPSGHFHRRKRPLPASQITPTLETVKNKTKMAAWIVSNCGTKSTREKIVERLKEKMDIDVYGRCGNNHCPPEGNCRDAIAKDYKFYLSFENSLCVDYATEKFFEAFAYDMIPITYGLADYTKIAPPNSYINLLDFKSLDKFVAHIEFLDQNPEEYLKYFQWKQHYVVITNPTKAGLCNACVKLHESHRKTRIVEDYVKWWTNLPENATSSFKNFTTQYPICLLPAETGFMIN